MSTILFDKPSMQSFWVLFLAKFRNLFAWITGYDLMFESSRTDIKSNSYNRDNGVRQWNTPKYSQRSPIHLNMKRSITTIAALLIFCYSYGGFIQLYLGLRAGAGLDLTHEQLNNFNTSEGFANVVRNADTWSLHAKGEALLGIGRFRIGYQFLYNFIPSDITPLSYTPVIDNSRYTTYFNSSQSHYFGNYALMEIAIINLRHFALTPGVGLGSYTGYNVDQTTGDKVPLSADTHHRFSMSAELNAEIKFGRCAFLIGPNYYLFSAQDKANINWRQYQNFIGADIGLRVNLLKP
jgi:hypothetical protein